jgi:hypothetical protein
MNEVISVHKKDVPIAILRLLDGMVPLPYLDNVFNAYTVRGLISGKHLITETINVNIGLDSGLSKAIPSGGSANSQVIVFPHSEILKTTGWIKYLRNRLIMLRSVIWFVMPPIFIRMAVC